MMGNIHGAESTVVYTITRILFFKFCQKYYHPSIILINVLFISAGGIKITDECGNISCAVSEAGVIIRTWCIMQ